MKLAVSCIAWEQSDEALVADVIKSEGFEYIEVVPGRVNVAESHALVDRALAYRKFWNERGVSCVAMQALLFGSTNLFLFESEKSRNAMLTHLALVFTAGEILGVKNYVFGSPKNRIKGVLNKAEADDIAVNFFKEAAELAQKHQGCLCIEANPSVYGADYILNTDQAFELVEKVEHPGFGLHIDTGGMLLAEESLVETIGAYAAHIKHFHISAPQLMPIYESDALSKIKDGLIALQKSSYQGYVSLEMSGLGLKVDQQQRVAHVRKGLSCINELIRP
jgi:D-psicose/D-tagatose/L-ribulose 3-epimerase